MTHEDLKLILETLTKAFWPVSYYMELSSPGQE